MEELLSKILPYALPVFSGLAGFGGSRWYGRRNGKGNGKYVTRGEFLKAMETIRKEGREDRQIIFKKLDKLSGEVAGFGREVARIQGAHEGK